MPKKSTDQEIVLKGTAASAGVADGKALLYLQKDLDVPSYDLPSDAVELEIDHAVVTFEHVKSKEHLHIAITSFVQYCEGAVEI